MLLVPRPTSLWSWGGLAFALPILACTRSEPPAPQREPAPAPHHYKAGLDGGTQSATGLQVDPFAGEPEIKNQPPTSAFVITPSDTATLTAYTRWLYVGVTGDVTVTMINGGAYVTLKAMPVGLYQLGVAQVWATGTTATNLVGLQ